MIKATYKHSTF